ncbi:S-layer family protein [Mastigocoleus testarum]|uniref:Uncharacterized protein n=1 Tax=Mastigocoleus testarum BC008 TaxID=371196 RepID=A0A0V7ZNN0_9CYAN|nr:S-layer family protein [Mastigocoleus testarum]KST66189.1 hypothetical protein BC008_24780 [Mastigocoleus testarum BC008]
MFVLPPQKQYFHPCCWLGILTIASLPNIKPSSLFLRCDPSSSLTALPSDIVDRTQQIARGCSANQGNSFTIIGKGGFPTNPEDIISQVNVWEDLRDINIVGRTQKTNIQIKNNFPEPIIEATNLVIDKHRNFELIARSGNLNTQNNWRNILNCSG